MVVQSMTNTDTADIAGTVKQVAELWRAGSELVRITVNNPESAAAVPRIREKLDMMVEVPMVGDFHYNGHQLLTHEPACAEALAKYRINPGNVGFGKKKGQPVRRHRRTGRSLRQAGAHRRQLGLARPVAGRAPDGRKRRARRALGRRACAARGAGAFGAGFGRKGRGNRPAARPHHPVGQGQRRAGTDRGVPRPGHALRTSRCIWA